MSDADEIEALVARIIAASPYGRQWSEEHARQKRLEDRFASLLRVGLDRRLCFDLFATADIELMDEVLAVSQADRRRLNRAYRLA